MASHDTAQSNTENQVELEVAKRLIHSHYFPYLPGVVLEHHLSFPGLVFLLFFSVSLLLCLCSSGFSPWIYLGFCPALGQPVLIMCLLFLQPFWCPIAPVIICSPAAQWHVTDQLLEKKCIMHVQRSCDQDMTWTHRWQHTCIRVGCLVGLGGAFKECQIKASSVQIHLFPIASLYTQLFDISQLLSWVVVLWAQEQVCLQQSCKHSPVSGFHKMLAVCHQYVFLQ